MSAATSVTKGTGLARPEGEERRKPADDPSRRTRPRRIDEKEKQTEANSICVANRRTRFGPFVEIVYRAPPGTTRDDSARGAGLGRTPSLLGGRGVLPQEQPPPPPGGGERRIGLPFRTLLSHGARVPPRGDAGLRRTRPSQPGGPVRSAADVLDDPPRVLEAALRHDRGAGESKTLEPLYFECATRRCRCPPSGQGGRARGNVGVHTSSFKCTTRRCRCPPSGRGGRAGSWRCWRCWRARLIL